MQVFEKFVLRLFQSSNSLKHARDISRYCLPIPKRESLTIEPNMDFPVNNEHDTILSKLQNTGKNNLLNEKQGKTFYIHLWKILKINK